MGAFGGRSTAVTTSMGMYALYFLDPSGQKQQMYLLDRSSTIITCRFTQIVKTFYRLNTDFKKRAMGSFFVFLHLCKICNRRIAICVNCLNWCVGNTLHFACRRIATANTYETYGGE
jgi:hypothetical protein